MYPLIRSVLFHMDPERAHRITLRTLSLFPGAARLFGRIGPATPHLSQTLWGLSFPHPIGLAAGLDKDGIAIDGLLACGFSFLEVGTVTPRPQPGNPKPRLFRLLEDEALINRMGFNNRGAAALRKHLSQRRRRGIVGVNCGRNKTTHNEWAAEDYLLVMETVYPLADYIVINVSSPNTPGLRDLQAEESLLPLVARVLAKRDELYQANTAMVPHRPPVLVKLSPDLPDDTLVHIAQRLCKAGVDGLIATNTTVRREGLSSRHSHEQGGLSGKPLRTRSTQVIARLHLAIGDQTPIIGCGGVSTAQDAYEKICAGASLVQVYTAFIYHGPALVRSLVQELPSLLARDGFSHIREAVGSRAKTLAQL
ncbi:dihydroorotate dehydrogenase (quinone) [Alicyclobacillus shizuokensis]|uniref:dihydroorotate dehydrogenase (quinone) n=1 Tax=Alicyclobacillus shizuokensis TaxID=392014 RepID=UPI00082E574C|nr:dihydroorotate dehydrogenase (quinone) [Alicyclobacillus shizuokensis]MCL6625129.1 dihydroorotate dehydrogenase (quinone) [Alicyclobacillus shizuokensis]